MSDRGRVMLVGAAAMGAEVTRLLEEYERDAKRVIVIDKPTIPDFGMPLEANRKERRAYSSKKLRLKGLRP